MWTQKVPAKNTIFFSWLNQYAGILLRTPSKTFAIDPVEVNSRSLQGVDAILITHEHYDHLDPRLLTEIQKATNCTIIANGESAKKLQYVIPSDKLHSTEPGDVTKFGKVTVKTKKCNYFAQEPVTYVITSEDNVKIYHTADSLPFPELALMGQKEKFDVVFCTVGIAPGTSAKTGFEIARLTKPQVAIPYHTASSVAQLEFANLIEKDLCKTSCLVPKQNKIYEITKKEGNVENGSRQE